MEADCETKLHQDIAVKQALDVFNIERADSLKDLRVPNRYSSEANLNMFSDSVPENKEPKDPCLDDQKHIHTRTPKENLEIEIPDLDLPPSYTTSEKDAKKDTKNFSNRQKFRRFCGYLVIMLVFTIFVFGLGMMVGFETSKPVLAAESSRTDDQTSNQTQKIEQNVSSLPVGKTSPVITENVTYDNTIPNLTVSNSSGKTSENNTNGFSQNVTNHPQGNPSVENQSKIHSNQSNNSIADNATIVPTLNATNRDPTRNQSITPTEASTSLSSPGLHPEQNPLEDNPPVSHKFLDSIRKGFYGP